MKPTNMPKIVSEKIGNFKFAPRKAEDPAGAQRISYVSNTTIAGEPFQSVKELIIPPYAWQQFQRNRTLHFIQTDTQPPMQFRIGIGGQLLRTSDMPPLSWYGRIRLRIYWTFQKFLGNV